MLLKHLPPLLLLFVYLTGCTLLQVNTDELDSRLDQWVAEQEYGQALSTLARIPPTDPTYSHFSERRKHIEELAQEYEKSVVRDTERYIQEGKWAQALDTYDLALSRLPDSAVIRDAVARSHLQQKEETVAEERSLLEAKAEWLVNALPHYENIARINPRARSAQSKLRDIRDEAEQVASELATLGTTAFENGHISTAQRLLPLAAKLSDEPGVSDALSKLRSYEQERAQQRQAAAARQRRAAERQRQQQQQRMEQMRSAYRQAVFKKDYLAAREQMQAWKKAFPGNREIISEEQALERAISEEVERLHRLATLNYSRSEFEQALKHWEMALELDPNHAPSRESYDRAKRVVDKLQELRGAGGS